MNRNRYLFFLSLAFILVFSLAACSQQKKPESVYVPSDRDRLFLDFDESLDANLYGGKTYCEPDNGAELLCEKSKENPGALSLTVSNIGGNQYAVWRTDLTGELADASDYQALRLQVSASEAGLNPHLYLIDQDGVRAWVELGKFVHPTSTMQEIDIPLIWFQDSEGRKPDLSRLAEFQIVFEWEDMAGTLAVDNVLFDQHVQKNITIPDLPEGISSPEGFTVTPVAGGFTSATVITFDDYGGLWLSQQDGDIWKLEDLDSDGLYERASLFASGFDILDGLLWYPGTDMLYVGSRPKITLLQDENSDGRADVYTDLVTDLPWGRHQNNGLAMGTDGMIYFGLGSGGDISMSEPPLAATILRMPHLGHNADLEVVARGVRNAYDLAFNKEGALFATDNGPDYNDAPDELNHIIFGENYGYPYAFGDDDGGGKYRKPIWNFEPHASATGITAYEADAFPADYRGNLFVTLFGQLFGTKPAGHRLDRIILIPTGDTYRAQAEPFLTGLDRPLDVTVGPNGSLFVLEYVSGNIYRIDWTGDQ